MIIVQISKIGHFMLKILKNENLNSDVYVRPFLNMKGYSMSISTKDE